MPTITGGYREEGERPYLTGCQADPSPGELAGPYMVPKH